MKLRFCDATPDDAPDVAALQNAAAGGLTVRFGVGRWSSLATELSIVGSMRAARVRVGRSGRHVVTVLRLVTKKPMAIDASYFTPVERPLYLTSMAVAPAHQRQGFGRQALDDARDVALAWPADGIRLDAFDVAGGAGAFYERCGYEDRGRVVYKGNPLRYFELLLS